MSESTITIQASAGSIGANIEGVNLCKPLLELEVASIKEALLRHHVIFFRDQPLSPQDHKRFASYFGSLEKHVVLPHLSDYPEIVVLDSDHKKPPVEEWHTDVTYDTCPPLGSILHCQIAPSFGGDTLWSNMQAAYEGLSDRLQQLFSSMTAVHSFEQGYRHTLRQPNAREIHKEVLQSKRPVCHPVVRTHPETKRKGIFVNQLFTSHIEGVSEYESRSLLNLLFEHIARPEFTCRFRWQNDSVAFWDNRSTQHCPINDFFPQRRRMQRIVIAGDQPF